LGKNGKSYTSILLHQSIRAGAKVKSRSQNRQSVQKAIAGAQAYLAAHRRAKVNTHAHALTCMLALKVRRRLKAAWEPYDLTVEEGLRELEQLCVMELVERASGQVIGRLVPEPNAQQRKLMEALGLKPPTTLPEAKVTVGTRVKIYDHRKKRENKASN
jgi:hypothetical protein